ncbi:hypothetical protein [Brevifollis gellanilyticus]|uniref:DUF1795 domain-containing protein n=1 Tax=Brevifollis gellanilyticus TaxID=748831 RepID=A0A512M9P7_9BACT|nr:hypothetical protein [Brevifollis gellanilyticus]GEP43443.1 hypothetical protein BGE01nite_27340 [Brevifollis gellanilyticus]
MGPALQGQEAAATSSLREVGGLKLNCPLPLEEKSKTGENEMMHSQAQYSVKTDGYEVAVVSIHYKDSVPLDLQKISQGSANSMSKLEGVTNPKTEFKNLTLAGADEARLMSFKADRFGKVLRTESTYIRKGQQLWMAIVTFTEDDKRSIFVGETISKSVRLQ